MQFFGESTAVKPTNGHIAGDLIDLLDCQLDTGNRIARSIHAPVTQLLADCLQANLGKLVDHAHHPLGFFQFRNTDLREESVRRTEVVYLDYELARPQLELLHDVSHGGDHLGLHHERVRPCGIDIELGKLPIAPHLRIVTPEYRADVIAAEGQFHLLGILGDQPGKGNGKVEPQTSGFFFGSLQLEDQLVGLFAAGTYQGAKVLEHRGINGREAVALVYSPDPLDRFIAGDHGVRQQIAKALQGFR